MPLAGKAEDSMTVWRHILTILKIFQMFDEPNIIAYSTLTQ